MQLAVYLIAYPLLWLVSILPFRILYLISDGMFLLLYYLIGYRKKVVFDNLKLVFPEKDEATLKGIQKEFYKHMCDMFLEMIKSMGISDAEMQKRFTLKNKEVATDLVDKNQSFILMLPHYASWEWTMALQKHIKSKGYGIYQPIANKYFDKLVRDIRSKYGTTLISTKATKYVIKENFKNNIPSVYCILSDQSPQPHRTDYWNEFMGIKVPIHVGAEKLSKRYNLPVVYQQVEKLKRGHYQATYKLLTETPAEMADYEVTDAFLAEVEKSIRAAPSYYFWTHKRWKHRGKEPIVSNKTPKKVQNVTEQD